MDIKINWQSKTGNRTDDNRDYAGVGIRDDAALYIVMDGSTSGQESGALARQVTQKMIDWYTASEEKETAETLTDRLRQIHEETAKQYPLASASFAMVHIEAAGPAIILHAGDCLVGMYNDTSSIQWLTQPHTLANATAEIPVEQIAHIQARHILTRSFRAKEFMPPHVIKMSFERGSILVLATDGFWADIPPSEQVKVLNSDDMAIPDGGDDRSILRIHLPGGNQGIGMRCPQAPISNLYMKTSTRAKRSAK